MEKGALVEVTVYLPAPAPSLGSSLPLTSDPFPGCQATLSTLHTFNSFKPMIT